MPRSSASFEKLLFWCFHLCCLGTSVPFAAEVKSAAMSSAVIIQVNKVRQELFLAAIRSQSLSSGVALSATIAVTLSVDSISRHIFSLWDFGVEKLIKE